MTTFITQGPFFTGTVVEGMRVGSTIVEEAVLRTAMPHLAFDGYPKTPRLRRDVVITEKIDGTNAQIVITPAGLYHPGNVVATQTQSDLSTVLEMRVGSRNRWITPGKDTDNYGFAGWVQANAQDLFQLGVGQHFGEWWGLGIARGYGMDRKVFSLFNTARWGAHNPNTPACVRVVPVVAITSADTGVSDALIKLKLFGSLAAPGFFGVEGVCVYHTASKTTFKVLMENDGMSKGEAEQLPKRPCPSLTGEAQVGEVA